MATTFKPKHKQVHVPGHGVIQQADFNEDHLKACLKQVKTAGLDPEEYLRKRFDRVGYTDLPLFEDEANSAAEEEARMTKEKADKEAADLAAQEALLKKEADDLAKLEAEIAAEEEAKKKASEKI
jgi:hypothetical protein